MPKPGEVAPVLVPVPVAYDLNDITIDLGIGHAELNARVVSVEHENGLALVELEPATSQERREKRARRSGKRAPVGGGTASCRHIARAVAIGISR